MGVVMCRRMRGIGISGRGVEVVVEELEWWGLRVGCFDDIMG